MRPATWVPWIVLFYFRSIFVDDSVHFGNFISSCELNGIICNSWANLRMYFRGANDECISIFFGSQRACLKENDQNYQQKFTLKTEGMEKI